MPTPLAFLIGLTLPTLCGWLLLDLLQRKKRVLFRTEQAVMGSVLGVTLSMWCMFVAHAYGSIPLNAEGFLGIELLLILLLGLPRFFVHFDRTLPHSASGSTPRWLRWTLGLLIAWVVLRALTLGITFLLLTPTFLDDSLDNWNMRGKLFFEDQSLTLVLPGDDPLTSPLGISSYPPTVPLFKTSLAVLAGEWSEPLINAPHLVWYFSALLLVYYALRRRVSTGWSLLGIFLLGSLPLYQMHGTNPYADVFLSVHIFLAVSQLFFALTASDNPSRLSHAGIAAISAGLLPFVKNEGLLLYLPPILLILAIGIFFLRRARTITGGEGIRMIVPSVGWIALILLPWLSFKLVRGMTIGNNYSSPDAIGWQPGTLLAIVTDLFFQGSWHLLFPLLITLLIWRRRSAFHTFLPLTAFFVIVYLGQIALFLFTPLSTEALMQTGYNRALIHFIPVIVFLCTLLLQEEVTHSKKSKTDRIDSTAKT